MFNVLEVTGSRNKADNHDFLMDAMKVLWMTEFYDISQLMGSSDHHEQFHVRELCH